VSAPAVADLGWKFVVALKDGLPAGVALNAAAHLALGLREKAQSCPELVDRMAFIAYEDAGGGRHEPISALSLIVLTGRPQLERTKATPDDGLDYYGVALFGPRVVVDPLTRRLSLWR